MKYLLVSFCFLTLTVSSCRPRSEDGMSGVQSAREGNLVGKIKFAESFDLSKATGQSYLAFMKKTVKPAIDRVADGYQVADARAVKLAYDASDTKVKGKVDKMWGGVEGVSEIVEKLAGQTVNLNTLPAKIAAINPRVDRFGIASFIGLASGGGVAIKYAEKNYAFNVHYDKKNQQSGRSFGTGPLRGANDASDKQYLTDLQHYTTRAGDGLQEFYKGLMEALLNSDPSNYQNPNLNDEGQALLTDFLAVYTAEQARNLMDGRITLHWDAALLEVTLLAAFHAGQKQIKLYYTDRAKDSRFGKMEFTAMTKPQTPCANAPDQERQAKLSDYWQFSKNITVAKNCRRSGINITKNEFRRLGRRITSYMIANHNKDIYIPLAKSLNGGSNRENMFESLSAFLINSAAPDSFGNAKVGQVTDAWIAMLNTMNEEADNISEFIERKDGSSAVDTADNMLEPEEPGFEDEVNFEDETLARLMGVMPN